MKNTRKKIRQILADGIVYQNPLFVLLLGVCPAVYVSSGASLGLAMGLATCFTLLGTEVMISALKRIIPQQVRIPCEMVIIASFVMITRYVAAAYFPALENRLGIYLPLMLVNCIILGRAEGFAKSHSIFDSAMDAIASGLGYTLALTLMGALRELLGSGTIFGFSPFPYIRPIPVFLMMPGGLFTLGCLAACAAKLGKKQKPAPGCEGCPAEKLCKEKGTEGCEIQ